MSSIYKISKIVLTVIICFFLVAMLINAFLLLPGSGDEGLFIRDLDLISKEGWRTAIIKGISIPYMVFAYPFSFFLNHYMALRVANWILIFLLALYVKNSYSLLTVVYLLFYLCTIRFLFNGINDTIFCVSLIVFLSETYLLLKKEKFNFSLALTTLIIAIFTRQIFLVFTPVILGALFFIYTRKSSYTAKLSFPFFVLLFLLMLNTPSLKNNNHLSYDVKSSPQSIEATWIQRQYLAQLLVNSNKLKNYNHPSWQQTVDYLIENGEGSLPKTLGASIFFDIKLTLKEYVKDLLYCLFYMIRQLGFMFYLSLIFVVLSYLKKTKLDLANLYVLFSTLVMINIFSFIIISYVELRWLIPVFSMTILAYSSLEIENRIPKIYLTINNVVLILFSIKSSLSLLKGIV